MESWSYIPEERSYLFSDEMDFSLDAFMRNRKPLVEWENKTSSYYEKDGSNSDKETVKSMEFVDLGFPDFLQKSFCSKPMEPSSCELDSSSSKRGNFSTHVINLSSSFGEEESESKHLSSRVESKTRDSSLIDLKLGASIEKDAKGITLTPMHPTTLAKRRRTSCLPAQALVCQVHGCNMDLSSAKDYHKRHKVCDVHSKTAKVIVNGIEQRFCQQCSRFHLLAEFDDGKRSCRRRLAGHNERRRKPQFDNMTSKQQKILQSYQGAKYLESFKDIFQSGILFPGNRDQISQSGYIKVEEEPIYSPQVAAAPTTLGQELSSGALSLLSAQSPNPLRFPAGNSLASSLIFQGIHMQDRNDRVSEKTLRISSLDKHVPHEDCEHGATVDLFQLASHLQMVEQQRNSGLVKWENEECCFPTV